MIERLRDTWQVSAPESSGRGYTELAAVAHALGVPFEKGLSLSVLINRTRVRLTLDIDSGSVTGVLVVALLEGPEAHGPQPFMVLRTETPTDVADKQRGLSREVQLGVPAFDRAVYIDSNATDSEVKRVLAKEPTRAAVAHLLKLGVPEVRLTSSLVELKLKKPGGGFELETLLTAIEGVLVVARGGGVFGRAQPRRGESLPKVGLVGLVVTVPLLLFAYDRWDAGLGFFALAFFSSSTVVFILAKAMVAQAVKGDSGSGGRARAVGVLIWLNAGAIGASAALGANARMGDGTQLEQGEVISVGSYDDDSEKWSVSVRWSSGVFEQLKVRSQPSPGQAIKRTSRTGGLGFRWGKRVSLQ